MQKEKLVYQTKLGTKQFIRAFLRSLVIIVPGIFLLIKTFQIKSLFYLIIVILTVATIFLCLRTIKKFKIYSNSLIVQRPFLKSEIFPIKEIKKITFTSESNGKVKLFYMRIESNKSKNEFNLIYFGKELQEFVKQLKIIGIKVQNDLINY